MARRPTALASLARYALDAAASFGLDRSHLIADAGLDVTTLSDVDGRVPVAKLMRLWERAAELSGDDFFGLHVAERMASAETVQVVGFAARGAATLGEAIATVGRFARVMNETTTFELVRTGTSCSLRVGPATGHARWPRAYAEVVIGGYLKVGRMFAGEAEACSGASFEHARPPDASEYHRFFGPTVSFSAAFNSLSFPGEFLDLPLELADPALAAYLRAQAQRMLEQLPAVGATRQRVREVIVECLSEAADVGTVARRCGLSKRTLQRSLREEGTSFHAIRDEVRKRVALDLLAASRFSVAEVAALVGYANTSAFRAAVRRWTGGSARGARRGRDG